MGVRYSYMSKQYDGFFRVISILFTASAGIFVLMKDWQFSKPEFFVLGLVLAFAGCLIAAVPGKSWAAVFGMILVGFYFIARGTGRIEQQVLRFGLGGFLLALTAVHIYKYIEARKTEG